jgi:thymidylate synthase (FAD)
MDGVIDSIKEDLNLAYDEAETFYRKALDSGVAREQARTIMPMGQYTEFFWNIDLHNLLHFLELRMHPHAQQEIRDYAGAVYQLLKLHGDIPWTLEVFDQKREVTEALQNTMRGLENFSELAEHIRQFKK